jgi:NADPH2:quinone reductase
MQVVRVHTPGGPETMAIDELETPTPGPGQALVRVEAAGVNFIDVYLRTGLYPSTKPLAMGLEGAGVIEALAPDVDVGLGLELGDRVAWSSVPGSYATHLLAPADRLVRVPDNLDLRSAAAVMLQGMTAHYLTRSTFPLGPGHRVLVHAAAGGVGLLLCQLGRSAGAIVLGTVSTEEKAALAREAGATHVIRYTEEDFADAVVRLTGGEKVHVVYDSVGKTTFDRSLDSLAPRGMMVLFGGSSGPVPPFDLQVLNAKGSLYVTRPSLGHYTARRAELVARASDVLGWVASGELIVRVDRALPLGQVALAHRLLESRVTSGKLLLLPHATS